MPSEINQDPVTLITSKITNATNIAWSLKHAGSTMTPKQLEVVYSRLYDDLNSVMKMFERLSEDDGN